MKILGSFLDGRTAGAKEAVLEIGTDQVRVLAQDGTHCFFDGTLHQIRIEPILGKTRRIIRFPQQQQFETNDFENVARLEKKAGLNRPFGLISFLETYWPAALVCLAGLIAVVCLAMIYGMPWAAKKIAFKIPSKAVSQMGRQAMVLFDDRFFGPSSLTEQRQQEIRDDFIRLARELNTKESLSLVFRQGNKIGANAFALPSGTIVMTDELVKSAETLRELEGIMIHEIAHVTNRHTIRSVIQNTGVIILVATLTGDVTSISSIGAGIPTLLLESGYSRRFEMEADRAVGEFFLAKHWPIKPYEDILKRIVKTDPKSHGTDIVSTHPDVQKRILMLEKMFSQKESEAK